jgi:hypothetical protein
MGMDKEMQERIVKALETIAGELVEMRRNMCEVMQHLPERDGDKFAIRTIGEERP